MPACHPKTEMVVHCGSNKERGKETILGMEIKVGLCLKWMTRLYAGPLPDQNPFLLPTLGSIR